MEMRLGELKSLLESLARRRPGCEGLRDAADSAARAFRRLGDAPVRIAAGLIGEEASVEGGVYVAKDALVKYAALAAARKAGRIGKKDLAWLEAAERTWRSGPGKKGIIWA